LEEHLKKHLPEYMIPKEIITVSLFPLNSNGKIDRKALINEYLQNLQVSLNENRPQITT
jgi:acyl-CoA synthetase (AMP-forming)/AMP-acid ligase II